MDVIGVVLSLVLAFGLLLGYSIGSVEVDDKPSRKRTQQEIDDLYQQTRRDMNRAANQEWRNIIK